MEDFINKNPEIVSKILEVEGFNKEKLEKILEITSNKKINFEFGGGSLGGFYLLVNLEKKIEDVIEFEKFLKEKDIHRDSCKFYKTNLCGFDYKVIIDYAKPSEVLINFYNPRR